MNLSPVVIAIPVFFVLILIEVIYEEFSEHKTYRLQDAVSNISAGILQQLSGLFVKVISIGVYTWVYEHFALTEIPMAAWSFVALFFLQDFCFYWKHRVAHRVSLFWGGHVVHHQSEEFNLSVALRQSSTEFLWGFPFYLPLAFLGFEPIQYLTVAGFNLLYQFWIHTEHIDKLPRWFEAVMNTPSHHRVHHARDPKYIDKNYAGMFILWDRMFGTFVEEEERPHYGVTVPIKSWNPIWANFNHYIQLGKALRQVRSFSDAWNILFQPPGWMPEYLGGVKEPEPVASTYKVYDRNEGYVASNLYLAIQFLLNLFVAGFFFFTFSSLNSWETFFFTLWLTLSAFSFSFYFEKKGRWLFVLEALRLVLLVGAIVYGLFI